MFVPLQWITDILNNSPEPETPPPGHHLGKITNQKIFQRPQNRKDSSGFDDFLTKIIAAMRPTNRTNEKAKKRAKKTNE